jgi:two-component system response regulator VicR
MKILIVDDEKNIVDILSYNLKKEGYEIEAAYDGRAGLEAARTCSPDLILLDVMLPYMDGFEVCSEIRKTDRLTPIIMLTAREEERDKVYGLELGADDYITKPFSVRELLARVKTNVRRRSVLVEPAEAGDEPVRAGRLTIDVPRQTVAKDGVELDLTQREFELIRFMSRPCGKVFSREELMREVWQYEYYGDVRAVDVAIRRLREKIEDDPAAPAILMTKRGAGYYLEG